MNSSLERHLPEELGAMWATVHDCFEEADSSIPVGHRCRASQVLLRVHAAIVSPKGTEACRFLAVSQDAAIGVGQSSVSQLAEMRS